MSGKAIATKSLKEKWLSIVQSAKEKGEKGIGGSSTITLPPSLLRDSDSNFPSVSHSGSGCTSCGCGWATGAHMTEFPTDGTGTHEAGALGVSRSGHSAEGANVLGALGADMLSGLALKASYHGGCWRDRVGDVDGVGVGTGSHNHLQSSGESNASRAHRRSSSSVNSRPTPLSRSSVSSVVFSRGKGVWLARGKGVSSSGQLGKWIDCGIGGGNRVGGQRGSCWARGAGFDEGRRGSMVLLLLNCSLHCIIGVVIGLSLSLRQ